MFACLLRQFVLFVVLNEGIVAVIVVLGNDVTYETGEIACPIAVVEDIFEVFTFSFVDQLQVIVLLIQKLPFHFN